MLKRILLFLLLLHLPWISAMEAERKEGEPDFDAEDAEAYASLKPHLDCVVRSNKVKLEEENSDTFNDINGFLNLGYKVRVISDFDMPKFAHIKKLGKNIFHFDALTENVRRYISRDDRKVENFKEIYVVCSGFLKTHLAMIEEFYISDNFYALANFFKFRVYFSSLKMICFDGCVAPWRYWEYAFKHIPNTVRVLDFMDVPLIVLDGGKQYFFLREKCIKEYVETTRTLQKIFAEIKERCTGIKILGVHDLLLKEPVEEKGASL